MTSDRLFLLNSEIFADLLPPVRPVHLPGARKLLLGAERRLHVHRLPAEIRREQRGPLRLPHLLFLHHHPQHFGAHLSLRQVAFNVRGNRKIKRLTRCANSTMYENKKISRQHGDHPAGEQLLHRLGQEDVLLAQQHACRGSNHYAERGARPDQVRLQRQNGHAHPEHHDLQQVLHQRQIIR